MTVLVSLWQHSCIIEFDGASKGNPGPAGAAAVLRTEAGNVVCYSLSGNCISPHINLSLMCYLNRSANCVKVWA